MIKKIKKIIKKRFTKEPSKSRAASSRKKSVRKFSKRFSHEIDFKRLEKEINKPVRSRKALILIYALIVILFLLVLYNFISLIETKRLIRTDLRTIKNEIGTDISKVGEFVGISDKENSEQNNSDERGGTNSFDINISSNLEWRSFGDNFSSSAYLDMAETDMYLDDTITSLSFPPLISIEKVKDCEEENCGLEGNEVSSCLKGACLKVEDGNLKLNNKVLSLPAELKGKNILNINFSNLETRRVVSFVVSEGSEERGFVYFLNGRKFEAIIGEENGPDCTKILTQYSRGGGRIYAGGDDDDFIIFYSGYEDIAYHFKDGALFDISRFFGLRVSDRGFKPYILKQGEGKKSLWYIINLDNEAKKFIKLWQNGSENIVGAIDLSEEVFGNLAGSRLNTFKSGKERGEINFVFGSGSESYEGGASSGASALYKFKDEGFSNSRTRVVVSKNVAGINEAVSGAVVQEIGLALLGGNSENYGQDYSSDLVKLYLGNSENNFINTIPKNRVDFESSASELFWKAEFFPGENKEYSPWFNHLNYLNYLVEGKS